LQIGDRARNHLRIFRNFVITIIRVPKGFGGRLDFIDKTGDRVCFAWEKCDLGQSSGIGGTVSRSIVATLRLVLDLILDLDLIFGSGFGFGSGSGHGNIPNV
jgi:hypothetical protein